MTARDGLAVAGDAAGVRRLTDQLVGASLQAADLRAEQLKHASAEHTQWSSSGQSVQRSIGRRECDDDTHLAIAGPVSDLTAVR
ncbi:hypothetical protein QFZ58_000226 [Streptomyces sp. B1I3]|nr:hypothetical protein [Streptomyces sp. B1I3]